MKLSPRLQAIAALVQPGAALADIGTDHAYLPIYLVEQGITPRAIAVDVHRGPYESALAQVKARNLAEKIAVRLGDGLEPVSPGEAQVAVLAGMGSSTIQGILERSPQVVSRLQQLVLQPMVGAANVRRWLTEHNWRIAAEELVADDGIIYVIISAVQGRQSITDWLALELGPVILNNRPPLLVPYAEKMLEDMCKIVSSLEQAESLEVRQRKIELQEKIKLLEGVLACR
nr:class I SAM-dependent methyltransferase [Zhaonella formicivorans]